jgi:ABC-type phosphate/phosphonate transport system substrate-binding protein
MAWITFPSFPLCLVRALPWALAAVCALHHGAEAVQSLPFHVNIGFSSGAFVSIPKEDIKIASRILVQKVARNTVGSADSKIYDSIADIEQDLKTKRLDVIALTTDDFLELSTRTPLDPMLVTATSKGHEVELLLLVRKDSAIRSFGDLRNRRIAIPAKQNQFGSMYSIWLETLVRRHGFPGGAGFFAAVAETKKPSQALMQVFFRQSDACVTTTQFLDLSSELNPQIGRELKVIERLPKLAGGIMAFRSDLPEEHKKRIRQALLTLHEDQEGKQLFVLFQLKKLLPYRPEYIRATEALHTEHRRLARRTGQKR